MNDDGKMLVFISYASQDWGKVQPLYLQLKDEFPEIDFWVDKAKLLPGMDWDMEIKKAIRACDAMFLILTNNSVDKEGYVQKEFKSALERVDEMPDGHGFLFLVRLEKCSIPFRFTKWQYCDLFSGQVEYEKLKQAIQIRIKQVIINSPKYQREPKNDLTSKNKQSGIYPSSKDHKESRLKNGSDKILIVTVTKVEAQAIQKIFCTDFGNEWIRTTIGKKTYYDLGLHGGISVFMVQSEMGSITPGGSVLTVRQAIDDLKPRAVIMCGIALGLQSHKQKLGDILISKQIMSYEPQKLDSKKGLLSRGDRTTVAELLLDRFRSADNDWQGVPTHFGLILSGEKLVNDSLFRDHLLELEPEAIGGEMEGAGLYIACRDANTDWILIKGICDWADGTKNDEAQPMAAINAAKFVRFVMELGGWRTSKNTHGDLVEIGPTRTGENERLNRNQGEINTVLLLCNANIEKIQKFLPESIDRDQINLNLASKNKKNVFELKGQDIPKTYVVGLNGLKFSEFQEILQKLAPSHIIFTGTAFGIDFTKQNVGDLLVSNKVLPYQIRDFQSGGKQQFSIDIQETYFQPSDYLIRIFNKAIKYKDADDHHLTRTGTIIYGPNLDENFDFRKQLRVIDAALAGGMCNDLRFIEFSIKKNIPWIIAMSIGWWPDGNYYNKNLNIDISLLRSLEFVISGIRNFD